MKYETIGKSNTKISKICLGCMSFGSKFDWMIELEEAKPIIDCALDLGINFFDTANAYSDGRSEEIVGDLLKNCRNDVILGTKVRYQMGNDPNDVGLSKKQIKKQFAMSLKRLQTDFIDLYQIHRWDYDTPIKETLIALDELVKDNHVRHLGASNMWTWQFAKCLWLSDKLDLHKIETIQTHYNLCYREEEREMIPFCKDQKISVFAYNPVAKGFLTGKYQRDLEGQATRYRTDPGFKPKFFKSQDFDVLEKLIEIANEKDVKPVQIALAWLQNKNITLPIIGVTKKIHVKEAVESLNIKLEADDIKRLEEVYKTQNVNHLD
tara:strand:+ start:17987 stop:18952 length:966 start_codon:yes stop_codon:yes gene_type:complete